MRPFGTMVLFQYKYILLYRCGRHIWLGWNRFSLSVIQLWNEQKIGHVRDPKSKIWVNDNRFLHEYTKYSHIGMLNLYIRKGTLAVCKEFELQNTENSNKVIECYHELLFSEVIMYYIIYIIATVHFNKRFQSYIHIYYIILSIVLYIILCITAI
jgi:hypothetical protein